MKIKFFALFAVLVFVASIIASGACSSTPATTTAPPATTTQAPPPTTTAKPTTPAVTTQAPPPPTTTAAVTPAISLTYGSGNASTHTFSQADVIWFDKIVKETGGKVKITPYWGATLLSSSENTAELIKGVADLGYLSPSTGFPIMLGSLGFPFGIADYATTVKIYDQIFKDFPECDAEWTALKTMAKSVASNYQIVSVKPLRTYADFKGLRIKAQGSYNAIAKGMGMEGVTMGMGDTYIALQKTTIDAAFAPYDTLQSFNFVDVAKYMTLVNLQSAVRPTRGMNLQSYGKLPPDIKKIFDDSVAFWSEEDNKARERMNQSAIEFSKAKGMQFINLSATDQAMVYSVADYAMQQEAAKLDAQKLPGTKLYKAVRALVTQYSTK